MSKSKRTQERYRKQNKNQASLTSHFGFTSTKSAATVNDAISQPKVTAPRTTTTSAQPQPPETDLLPPSGSRMRSASVLSDPSTDAGDLDDQSSLADVQEVGEDVGDEIQEEGLDEQESYESDLEEAIQGPKRAVKDWSELRKQIKTYLAKNSKSLPLSKINQYLMISNFATLRLKGLSRTQASIEIARQWHEGPGNWFARRVHALARHYQAFEELPVEKRGGEKNARSWLHDEAVQSRTRDWLTSQETGKVTPRRLQQALNEVIFPDLNIILKSPLSERTARRWLIKLGWRRTVVRKGVYMDGHEREDVVKYRNEIFLPAMARFEARMARFEGSDLKQVNPALEDGWKRMIALFHDECCFHANDEARSLWQVQFQFNAPFLIQFQILRLREGEQPLRKKGRGRLIHISDFICSETGRLVLRDQDGKIIRDARKIIFPGANGDPWWDTEQLIVQIKSAIEIFEAAHPGCQALFIFDQSSAHASLPPDALRAFDMNKSNGGKQRKQQDTVIPQSNPDPRYRGQPQSMVTPSGEAKGLKQVLKE